MLLGRHVMRGLPRIGRAKSSSASFHVADVGDMFLLTLGVFGYLITECHTANRGGQSFDGVSTRRPTSRANETSDYEPQLKSIFRPTQRNITVSPGDRAVLKCKVENLGTKTVTWRKRDDVHPLTIGLFQFAPDTRISVDFNQRTTEWTLTIQDVKPTDEGIYCCQLSTKHDRDTYDIRLNVRTIQVSGNDYIEAGSPVQLTCNATGRPDPPHNVDWYKDDFKVASDAHKGVIITKKIETKVLVSMLVIKRSRESDGGVYECRSSNNESGSVTVRILSPVQPEVNNQVAHGRSEKAFGRFSRAHTCMMSQQSVAHLFAVAVVAYLSQSILTLVR